MKYLHTMVRVGDLQKSLDFDRSALGLTEVRRTEHTEGRFTLVFLAAPGDEQAQIELTYNWDEQGYDGGRNFRHVAYQVDDIYAACERLQKAGVTPLNRPPRDGRMAFVRSPDNISVELLQKVRRCRPPSRGSRCRTPASGESRFLHHQLVQGHVNVSVRYQTLSVEPSRAPRYTAEWLAACTWSCVVSEGRRI